MKNSNNIDIDSVAKKSYELALIFTNKMQEDILNVLKSSHALTSMHVINKVKENLLNKSIVCFSNILKHQSAVDADLKYDIIKNHCNDYFFNTYSPSFFKDLTQYFDKIIYKLESMTNVSVYNKMETYHKNKREVIWDLFKLGHLNDHNGRSRDFIKSFCNGLDKQDVSKLSFDLFESVLLDNSKNLFKNAIEDLSEKSLIDIESQIINLINNISSNIYEAGPSLQVSIKEIKKEEQFKHINIKEKIKDGQEKQERPPIQPFSSHYSQ